MGIFGCGSVACSIPVAAPWVGALGAVGATGAAGALGGIGKVDCGSVALSIPVGAELFTTEALASKVGIFGGPTGLPSWLNIRRPACAAGSSAMGVPTLVPIELSERIGNIIFAPAAGLSGEASMLETEAGAGAGNMRRLSCV